MCWKDRKTVSLALTHRPFKIVQTLTADTFIADPLRMRFANGLNNMFVSVFHEYNEISFNFLVTCRACVSVHAVSIAYNQ